MMICLFGCGKNEYFKVSGLLTCYYRLTLEDPATFFNRFKSSLMEKWSLKREKEECLMFDEGVISRLEIYNDPSGETLALEVAFDGVEKLRDLFMLLELLMKGNPQLCRLMLEISVMNGRFFSRIANRIKRLRVKGLIKDLERKAFRCSISFEQHTFNLAFYDEDNRIEIIANLRNYSSLVGFYSFMNFISRKSIKSRLLDLLRLN